MEARKEVPQEMWDMYISMGITDLDEQKALKQRQYLLKVIWQRPSKMMEDKYTVGHLNPVPFEILFKKMKNDNNRNKEVAKGEDSIRSEETGTDASDNADT